MFAETYFISLCNCTDMRTEVLRAPNISTPEMIQCRRGIRALGFLQNRDLNGNEMNAGWKWISKGHGASSPARCCLSQPRAWITAELSLRGRRERERWKPPTTTPRGPPGPLTSSSLSLCPAHTHTGNDTRQSQVGYGGGAHYALMVRSINHKMMKAISFI